MKKLLLGLLVLTQFVGQANSQSIPLYKDSNVVIEKRVDDLLSKMTLDEMISMISGLGFSTVPNDRLGIPSLVMVDGHAGPCVGNSTSFATAITMAATWNPELIYQIGKAFAEETRAKNDNTLLAPNINLHRTPQAGRNSETFGEDPFLIGKMASAYIKGLQDNGVLATVKHFACNNQETNRSFIDVNVDERTLNEIYLPGFKTAIQEGGALAVMCSYNRVNGQYTSDCKYLLSDILKNKWDFKGMVMSDWGAVHSTIPAFYSGLDLEMPKGEYFTKSNILPLMENPIYKEQLRDKVRRILRTMYNIGIMDNKNPFLSKYDTIKQAQLSLQNSREGIVLLKNSNSILPFDSHKIKSLAVIGPMSKAPDIRGVLSSHAVNTYQGIKEMFGESVNVTQSLGCNIKDDGILINKDNFKSEDGKPGFVMEYFDNQELEGIPKISKCVDQISFSWSIFPPLPEIKTDKYSIRIKGTLTAPETGYYNFYLIMAFSNMRFYLEGKTLYDKWAGQGAWTKGIDSVYLKKGVPMSCVLEYKSNAQSYNLFSFLWKFLEQNPLQKAVALAKKSDAVVVCVGFSGALENEEHDRSVSLDPAQEELIKEISKVNKNIVVVMNSGSAVVMNNWVDKVPGIIEQWHPGQEGGTALAEILFGKVNPSGKLPVTFMKRWEDSPAFDYYPGKDGVVEYKEGINVGYRYFDRPSSPHAQFTFGYGLSYTTFEISNLKLSANSILITDTLHLNVLIKNTGKMDGAEVVQLYIGQDKCSVDRPIKELKAFHKIFLKVGEEKTIQFTIKPNDLKFYDVISHDWKAEPGTFTAFIGTSSMDIKQKIGFELK